MFKIARPGLLKVANKEDTRVHRSGQYYWHIFDSEEGHYCPSLTWHREYKPYSYVSLKYYQMGRYGEPEEFMIDFPCYLSDEHWLLVRIGKNHNGIFDTSLNGNGLTFETLKDLNETVEEFIKELSKIYTQRRPCI